MQLFVHENNPDGLLINGLIKTTTNHRFYSDGQWIQAGQLSIGDKILHVDGVEHMIKTLELNNEPKTVYNFEVYETHNYFAEGYLVHNVKEEGPGG